MGTFGEDAAVATALLSMLLMLVVSVLMLRRRQF